MTPSTIITGCNISVYLNNYALTVIIGYYHPRFLDLLEECWYEQVVRTIQLSQKRMSKFISNPQKLNSWNYVFVFAIIC